RRRYGDDTGGMGEVTPPGRGAPAAGDHRPSRREDRRGVRIRLRRDAAPELRGILRDEPHRLPPPLRCPRTHVSALAAARTDPLHLDRRATMTPRPHIPRPRWSNLSGPDRRRRACSWSTRPELLVQCGRDEVAGAVHVHG